MIDATILVPTHRHAAFLPCAIRSALAQQGVSVEVFVVGDGVDDETRAAVRPFLGNPSVRFFDFPKGERHGERHRHAALQEATGEIICYLSDDDLLLPGHVTEMRRQLAAADFAHSTPVTVLPDGVLHYRPADLARPEFVGLIRAGRNNFIGLTGAAHTRAAYMRLPHGWRPAPADTKTDIYMWQQIFSLPGFRGVTATRLTALHFPDPTWRDVDDAVRAEALGGWLDRALRPGGETELQDELEDAVWIAAQDFKLRSIELSVRLRELERELEHATASPWTKLRRLVTRRIRPARGLLGRLRRRTLDR